MCNLKPGPDEPKPFWNKQCAGSPGATSPRRGMISCSPLIDFDRVRALLSSFSKLIWDGKRRYWLKDNVKTIIKGNLHTWLLLWVNT